MDREKPNHELTHLLLGIVLWETTHHWLWAVFVGLQIVRGALFYVCQRMDQKIADMDSQEKND